MFYALRIWRIFEAMSNDEPHIRSYPPVISVVHCADVQLFGHLKAEKCSVRQEKSCSGIIKETNVIGSFQLKCQSILQRRDFFRLVFSCLFRRSRHKMSFQPKSLKFMKMHFLSRPIDV